MNDASGLAFTRIIVSDVVHSRYEPGTRPVIWTQRRPGLEQVIDHDGHQILLWSDGGQSSPAPGWELMLFEPTLTEDHETAFPWTLYGLRPAEITP